MPTPVDSLGEALRRIPSAGLSLFRHAFAGREDAWWRVRDGESGRLLVEPALMDGRPVPLASAHLEEHLAGAYHVAIDPLLPDGTVRFLVISLHSRAARTWKTDSLQLAIAARRLGIPLLLERTRTGNGLHAWVFFSSKVTASDARRLGAALLAEAGDGDPLRVRSFDRLYPRDPAQASTPDASVEDVVALPLQGALRSRNLTVFVRPQRGLPTIADQWTLLSLLPRLDVGLVQEIVRHAVREGPAPQRPSPATERRPRAPLEVTLSASLAVPRPLPRQVAAWLRETLATPNPAYQRRREQGLVLRGVPRLLAPFERRGTGWLLPRNLVGSLQRLCGSLGLELKVSDLRCQLLARPLPPPGGLGLREQQTLQQVLATDFCSLEMRQAGERTLVTMAAIASRGVPTLVVTSSRERMEMWRESAVLWLGLDRVSTLDELDAAPPHSLVTLATYSSASRSPSLPGLDNCFAHLVLDDCTRTSLDHIRRVAERVPAAYVLGLKDGPRPDGLDRQVSLFVGSSVQQRERTSPPLLDVVLRSTEFSWQAETGPRPRWNDLMVALSHDAERNALVVGDVLSEAHQGASCLVYTARREHAQMLADLLEQRQQALRRALPHTPPVVIATATGGLPETQRRAALRQFRDGRAQVLVVTEQLIGAGFDCPLLTRVFLAFPVRAVGPLRTYLQPLLRHAQGDTLPRVYDYVDPHVVLLDAMGRTRRRHYQRENTTLNYDAMQLRLPFVEPAEPLQDAPTHG